MAESVDSYLQHFELGEAQRELYDFIWHEFCDWYIELAKLRLRGADDDGDGESPLPVLAYVLEKTLRLLHPFMPFVTEEIWQRLKAPRRRCREPPWNPSWWPPTPSRDESVIDAAAEAEMNLVQYIITQVRNYRAEEKVPAQQQIEATVIVDGPSDQAQAATVAFHEAISSEAPAIKSLARISELDGHPAQRTHSQR